MSIFLLTQVHNSYMYLLKNESTFQKVWQIELTRNGKRGQETVQMYKVLHIFDWTMEEEHIEINTEAEKSPDS